MTFKDKYGPTALIAGGSEGIGASYAHKLADQGFDLVIVARTPEPLNAIQADLQTRHPDRQISIYTMDLVDPSTPQRLADHTLHQNIGLLIYNAGSNTVHADFVDNSLDYAQRLTALNATMPMALCHHFGRAMKAKGRGGIILNSSMASFIGNPKLAVYSAAKAFLNTLGEALWYELKPHGVDVLVHVLGSVDTPFIARHYPQAVGVGAQPDDIAEAGLAALGDGPILRARGGDEFHDMLARMRRADAVEAAFKAGQLFARSEG